MFNLLVRGARPGKNVQLTEGEIKGLCLKSREIFLSQPILLELEAPLKICGKFLFVNISTSFLFTCLHFIDTYAHMRKKFEMMKENIFVFKVIFTDNTMIYCGYSNTADFRQKATIFFWETTWIEENSL